MMTPMEILSSALDIGEDMLSAGAEISRVEDTVGRIAKAYGASRADVMCITHSIVATLYMEGDIATQTRRVAELSIDLDRLSRLNALSRRICVSRPGRAEFMAMLREARVQRRYSLTQQCFIYAVIAGVLSAFNGASARDAAVSAVIGVAVRLMIYLLSGARMSRILAGAVYAFAGGFLALAALKLGLADSFDKIAIGVIMLLIPGLNLTNALNDMFSGDTLSGMMRLFEAVLTAVAIALGFALSGGLL